MTRSGGALHRIFVPGRQIPSLRHSPKYMRNRTLVSKQVSKDRNVMSFVSTAFKVHYNKKLGTQMVILGGTHHGLWGGGG